MYTRRNFLTLSNFDVNEVRTNLGVDRKGSPMINMGYGQELGTVAVVTPAAMTHWPRVSGEGNFGTMWGPTDPTKAKFSIDLSDTSFTSPEGANPHFEGLAAVLTAIDDKVLSFVHANQLKILGRKQLSIDEVKMLQIRTVRPRYNKDSGSLIGNTINLSSPCYAWDGMGGKYKAHINVSNFKGDTIPKGVVAPGDVVAVTMFAKQVYTGVGGDKFGIHWAFEDVSVICQRSKLAGPTLQSAFASQTYDFAQEYEVPEDPIHSDADFSDQFGNDGGATQASFGAFKLGTTA